MTGRANWAPSLISRNSTTKCSIAARCRSMCWTPKLRAGLTSRPSEPHNNPVLHDRSKRFRIKACAPNQCPVDFLFGHERLGILRFHRSSVQNAELGGEVIAEGFGGFSANQGVRFGGKLRGRSFPGSDRPYRLVGDDQLPGLLARNGMERSQALTAKYIFGQPGLPLF